ncbi:ATP-grasp domain-containing protein [Streptomyces sp. NPDC048106]|uniref:ATP-grasp domain-containing protein n=1 Tax=Streptomyces sp. NPDC048106 TaxID=3155750 RepID=UPI00345716C4
MSRAVAALVRAEVPVACAVAPGDAAAARAAGATAVVVPDPASTTGVLAGLARSGLAVSDFAAVCSGLEFCVENAAAISDFGGLGAPSLQRVLGMRDKFVQKQAVRRADVRAAHCSLVEKLDELETASLEFPKVLKPLDGGGARHTFLISDRESLREAVEKARQGGSGPWLIEEFIPGTEFQVDGLVRAGEIRLLSVSRYMQNLIEVHRGGIVAHVVLPPSGFPDLYAGIRDVTERALKALDYHDGVFHLEVFRHAEDGGIVFGECGARVGGGRTDEVVERAFGVNLHDEWARAALGRPSSVSGEPDHALDAVFGGVNLPARSGVLRTVPSAEEVLARPGVEYVEVSAAPGTVVPDATAASHIRAGVAVVSGADVREVELRVSDLTSWFAGATTAEPSGPDARG